jgi:hypothetical protein
MFAGSDRKRGSRHTHVFCSGCLRGKLEDPIAAADAATEPKKGGRKSKVVVQEGDNAAPTMPVAPSA